RRGLWARIRGSNSNRGECCLRPARKFAYRARKVLAQLPGDCRFPRARQSSEPNDRAAMARSRRSRSCCDLSFDPKNIFALRNRAIGIDAAKNCPASANLSVINNHKASEGGDPIIIVDHQRAARLNGEPADFI